MFLFFKNLLFIPYEYFGDTECFNENMVKRNLHIYRQYAVGSLPNYWFKEKVMDEWNAIICKFCNELPEEAARLSKWQMIKLRWHYRRLIIKDSLPE